MALSKQQLCAGMKRTRLSLEEKIKSLNYSNENKKKSCREIAAQFQIGKTDASSTLKDGKKLRKKFEFFEGNCKAKCAGQFSLINLQVVWKMLCCRYIPIWINVTKRGVENKGKLGRQFIGQFFSLQWLVR